MFGKLGRLQRVYECTTHPQAMGSGENLPGEGYNKTPLEPSHSYSASLVSSKVCCLHHEEGIRDISLASSGW